MDLEDLDTRSLLDELDIDYSVGGKNVTSGWTEVNCPFCEDDPSYHLGISPQNLLHCWRCGVKGNIIKYLKVVLDKPYHEIRNIIETFTISDDNILRMEEQQKRIIPETISLPREAKREIPQDAKEYLMKRRFDPQEIRRKYRLSFCTYLGDYKFRIIIPVYENKKLVSFTGRDYTGKASLNYFHDNSGSMIGKPYLYNIDSVKDKALIVEGITDTWRMGDGTIGTFGIEYSKTQVLKIARLGLELAIILFDDEEQAQAQAKKLALDISPYVEKVKIARFSSDDKKKKDPAEIFKDNKEGESIKENLLRGGTK